MGSGASQAQSESTTVPLKFTTSVHEVLGFVLLAAVAALVYGFILRVQVLKLSAGSAAMQEVGQAIRDGALAYLAKQGRTMLPLVGILSIALFFFCQVSSHCEQL